MPAIRTDAVVLHVFDYLETSRIFRLATREAGIQTVIDLEGGLDAGVCTRPGRMLYVYHPIFDEHLPDLPPFHAVARMAAELIRQHRRVLSHCGLGLNRSALMAGVILNELGMPGSVAVERLRERRPGALFNDQFAQYLASLPVRP